MSTNTSTTGSINVDTFYSFPPGVYLFLLDNGYVVYFESKIWVRPRDPVRPVSGEGFLEWCDEQGISYPEPDEDKHTKSVSFRPESEDERFWIKMRWA